MKRMRSPRSQAQRSVAAALDEVQTTPPRAPQNALIDAAELMYVTGTTPARVSLADASAARVPVGPTFPPSLEASAGHRSPGGGGRSGDAGDTTPICSRSLQHISS